MSPPGVARARSGSLLSHRATPPEVAPAAHTPEREGGPSAPEIPRNRFRSPWRAEYRGWFHVEPRGPSPIVTLRSAREPQVHVRRPLLLGRAPQREEPRRAGLAARG